MSLKDWSDNGWLKPHQTDKTEISNLLQIAERDLLDAEIDGLSADWKFGIAYNAALKLCNIVLYAQGFRPENALAHYRAIMALNEVDNEDWAAHSAYLNACRIQRNTLEYDCANSISKEQADKLVAFTRQFYEEIRRYLAECFPRLL